MCAWKECVFCTHFVEYSISVSYIMLVDSAVKVFCILVDFLYKLFYQLLKEEYWNRQLTAELTISPLNFQFFLNFGSLIGVYTSIIIISSWCTHAFMIMKCPSLSPVTFLALKSALFDINISIPALLWWLFVWHIIVNPILNCVFVSNVCLLDIAYRWGFLFNVVWISLPFE